MPADQGSISHQIGVVTAFPQSGQERAKERRTAIALTRLSSSMIELDWFILVTG